MLLTNNEFQTCKRNENSYICPQNYLTYKINYGSACELQMYGQKTIANCNIKYLRSNQTLIISLQNPYEWLYTTHTPQAIQIYCNDTKYTAQMIKTGLLRVTQPCKILINNVIIHSPGTISNGVLETYLPDYNLTLPPLDTNIIKNVPEIELKEIINDPSTLHKLGSNLDDISKELQDTPYLFSHKFSDISTLTSGTVTVIIIIIAVATILYYKRKTQAF